MKCQEMRELLVVYLDDEITPSERTLIQAHLAECDACQEELAVLSALQSRVSRSLQLRAAQAAPSPQAWSRLQARLMKRAPQKPWPQRLAPGVWHKMTTKGGEILMKHKFALATIATLVLAISVVAFVPAVRAQVGEAIARWFRIEVPGGGVVISGPAEFRPLRPTYLPAGLQSSVFGSKVSGESESIELTYYSDDQFVAITQTKAPADRTLPTGQKVTVNGQPAVLVTGLKGTYKFEFGPPEGAQVETFGTPPAKPVPHRIFIAYENGKRLTWYVGDVKLEMLSNLLEEEMLRIAESMVPAEAGEGEPPFQSPLDLPSGGEGKPFIIQEGPIEYSP